MKQEVKPIWKDIKELDAQIRTIEHQEFTKENERDYYLVEVGLFESLGESAGDILSLDYDTNPTEEEIKRDILEQLQELKTDYFNEEGELMLTLSGRQEKQAEVLTKILNLKPIEYV